MAFASLIHRVRARQMYLRTYADMNDTACDLSALSGLSAGSSILLAPPDGLAMAGTGALLAAPAP